MDERHVFFMNSHTCGHFLLPVPLPHIYFPPPPSPYGKITHSSTSSPNKYLSLDAPFSFPT